MLESAAFPLGFDWRTFFDCGTGMTDGDGSSREVAQTLASFYNYGK